MLKKYVVKTMDKVKVEYVFDNGWTVSGVVERAEAMGVFRNPEDLSEVVTQILPGQPVVVVLPPGCSLAGSVRGAS
jgi:hypothetical protein